MWSALRALACAALVLAGCGATRSPAMSRPAGDAISLPVAAGASAAAAAFSATITAVQEPFPGDEMDEYGTRVVGLLVAVTAPGEERRCDPGDMVLLLSDGEAITGRAAREGGLPTGALAAGERAEGWLVFAIYADAPLVALIVTLRSVVGDPLED